LAKSSIMFGCTNGSLYSDMLKTIQERDSRQNRWVKITLSVILGLIICSMVITLIPGLMSGTVGGSNPDAVASVGGQDISVDDVQRELSQMTSGQQIPPMMKGFYVQQALDEIVFRKAMAVEADRLGIGVTNEEETERIKEILPTAWNGDTWLKDRYASEVQQRTGMSVADFESTLRDNMLALKFQNMITAGITVSVGEVAQEYRLRNEKVKIDYALIQPSALAVSIHPSDADLAAYYQRNMSKYLVPEKRSASYAMLDLAKLRANTQVSDDVLRAYYNANIDQYKVQNRVHPEHILFKTVGQTDAEIAETRQKAEDVLKQARHGANFEDLAKKYSEDDGSKPKGGDLGWIVEGQTVPEFQQVAFSLPKGAISDLVKTEYGFHIIKVLDRETAHTQSFDEVRASILAIQLDQKVTTEANDISSQMAAAVRQSDRQPLEDLAKKFNLQVGQTPPGSATDPVGDLGNSQELHEALFELRPGELSSPLHLENGYVILTVKDIIPAHQGALAEVHDRVLADYQADKSVDLARTQAAELSKRVQSGEDFSNAAKSLGLDVKPSDSFARSGTIPDVGTGKQIESAFTMPVGHVSSPVEMGSNWLVYRVVSHDEAPPGDLEKQSKDIRQQLLQTKQEAAFAAFRAALESKLKSEGKLTINADTMKRLTTSS